MNNNKKIVIFNNSKTQIKKIEVVLKEKHKDKKIITHYANNNNNKNLLLDDINKYWDSDIFLYNIFITVGISYNNNNFDKLYVFLDGQTNIRDLFQSSLRIRNLNDNVMNVFMKNSKESEYEDINIKHDIEYIKNEIKKELYKDDELLNMYRKEILDDDNSDINFKEYICNYILSMPNELYNIYKRLLYEKKLNDKYYISLFKYFLKKSNYKYEYINKISEDKKKKLHVNKDNIIEYTEIKYNGLLENLKIPENVIIINDIYEDLDLM